MLSLLEMQFFHALKLKNSKIPNMKLVRRSSVNVILNVSALVTDSSSSLKHADIPFQGFS